MIEARAKPSGIAVVVPLYQHERWIGRALASVFLQSVAPDEIVVVDDGSRDHSLDVAREAARLWPTMRVETRPNRGAHDALATAITATTAPFVAILNSDDIFGPGRLEVALAAFEGDPDLDLVATGIGFVDAEGREIENPWYEHALAFADRCADTDLALLEANFFMTTSNFVVRRRVFEAVGGFAALRYAHDLDFLLRLLAAGRKVARLRDIHLHYRLHGGNTIAEGALRVKAERALVTAFHLERVGDGSPERRRIVDEILRSHDLREPVAFCRARFAAEPADRLEGHPALSDEAFLRHLSEVVT